VSDTESTYSKDRGKDAEPRVRPEPVGDPKFVSFLLSLWGSPEDRPTYPQKIEVWTIRNSKGKIHRLTQIRPAVIYSPTSKEPTQEEVVKLANEIFHDAQRHCNSFGKQQSYGVIPYQFGSGDDYVCVYGITFKPTEMLIMGRGKDSVGRDDDDVRGASYDDEDDSGLGGGPQARLLAYSLKQNEIALADSRFVLREALELVKDSAEALRAENESLRQQRKEADLRQLDMIKLQQDLLDRSKERELKARWSEVGVGTAEKTVDMGLSMLPAIVNRFSGKEVVPTKNSMESIIVANFIKSITPEQARAAFGYAGEGQPPVPDAIFSLPQGALFSAIAAQQVPGDRIDDFLEGGALEITGEQLMKAQALFSMEQLFPLGDLIRTRLERRARAQVPSSSPKP
jgi:hypothetical protein